MPDLGYTTQGASERAINAVMRGSVFTMPENGTLSNGSCYINDGATGDTFVMTLYNATTLSAATLVDNSATRTDISTGGLYTFTGWAGAALVSGTNYYIGVGSNSAADADVYHDAGTGYAVVSFNPSAPGATVDLDAGADARLYSTYITYTTAGGVVRRLMLLGVS